MAKIKAWRRKEIHQMKYAIMGVRKYLKKHNLPFQKMKHRDLIQAYANAVGKEGYGKAWIVEQWQQGAFKKYSEPKKAKKIKGIVYERTGFYWTPEWRQLRLRVFRSYGRKCQKCGNTKRLHIDHVKARSRFPELELCFFNLQVLCEVCNVEKSNLNSIDYRTFIDNSKECNCPCCKKKELN